MADARLEIGIFHAVSLKHLTRGDLLNQGFTFVTVPSSSITHSDPQQFSFFPKSCFYVDSLTDISWRDDAGSPDRDQLSEKSSQSNDSGTSLTMSEPVSTSRPTVLLDYTPDEKFRPAAFAMRFYETLKQNTDRPRPRIWFRIPMNGKSLTASSAPCPVVQPEEARRAYFYWHDILIMTRYLHSISTALQLQPGCDARIGERWLVEPIGCVIVPISLFYRNKPELGLFHQVFLKKCIQLNGCKVMLLLDTPDVLPAFVKDCVTYLAGFSLYIPPPRALNDQYLHGTMQPLHKNLCDEDYSGFERDRTKYTFYELAMVGVFEHLRRSRHKVNDDGTLRFPNRMAEGMFRVAVLGCGRGPLVTSVLNAAAEVYAKVKVYALDKNPGTRAILQKKHAEDWKDHDVELVFGDMREWKPDLPLDCIVSELIGNFADDECCPECLEMPEKILKPDGISIPQSYTNFLTPVSATRLYSEIRSQSAARRQEMRAFSRSALFEFFELAGELPIMTFEHGPRSNDSEKVSTRFAKVDFTATDDAMLHGFMGCFSLHLFGWRKLSTQQKTKTPGLNSWDRVFFPLMEPVRVLSGQVITLEFNRRRDALRVWYEYRLMSPQTTLMHNLDGEVQSFRLDFEVEAA